MNHHPTSFLSGPSYHPAPTPASRTGEERGVYVARGPGNDQPLLSVSSEGRCTLTKPLLLAANLSGGRPVRLVVPRLRGHDWYLDTNPKPGDGTILPVSGRAVFRLGDIPKMHFQRSGQAGPGFGNIANSFVTLLHFRLGEEVEGHPGYYHLHGL